MTNQEMKAGRFLRLARGRKILARMNACWDAGGLVRIATATRYTDLKPKHRDMVIMGKDGSLYMRRGRSADCIDYCKFMFTA